MFTLLRFSLRAYWMAERTRRSVPSREIGLMPMPLVLGNLIFFTFISFSRKAMTFLASSVSAAHSMPA
jgi:hypothetical protein